MFAQCPLSLNPEVSHAAISARSSGGRVRRL